MKCKTAPAIALIVVVFFLGLGNTAFAGDQLTNSKAYAGISRFMGGSANFGTLEIIGVLQLQQNVFQADYTVQGMQRRRARNDAVTAYAFGPGGESYVWSGSGSAIFVHYNDGNWRMIRLSAGSTVWTDISVAVP